MTLELFPPRTFDQLCTERRCAELFIRFNSRLRKSWYVKIHRNSNRRELNVPRLLEHAPEGVKLALIEWATLPKPRRPDCGRSIRERHHFLETKLHAYISDHTPALSGSPDVPFRHVPTKGCRWDLREIFDTLNGRYFDNRLASFLRWGSVASKTSYQSTRKDTSGKPHHCITIAGVYNHPEVPRFAVEAIMHHEMLHIHIPPRRESGRAVMHGPDFKRNERSFPHYRKWRQWEKEKLPSLLMQLRRKRKKGFIHHLTAPVGGVR